MCQRNFKQIITAFAVTFISAHLLQVEATAADNTNFILESAPTRQGNTCDWISASEELREEFCILVEVQTNCPNACMLRRSITSENSLQAPSSQESMMPPSHPSEDDEHTIQADRNGASILDLLLSGEASIITFESDSLIARRPAQESIESRRSAIFPTTVFSL